MVNPVVKYFSSLRLTVVLLSLGLVLVFWGTLAQVDAGLYRAQNDFFRSFFVYWQPGGGGWHIPIFPGGYLLGGLLLINLFVAHLRYYQPGWKKIGIVMIHLGIILLLLGQLLTDLLSRESSMHIRVGSSANYSEALRKYELAVIDITDPKSDKVVAIPEGRLQSGSEITSADLPFSIRVQDYFANSDLSETNAPGFTQLKTSNGSGAGLWWRQAAAETDTDRRDMPSGIIELVTPQGSLGTILISTYLSHPQEFTLQGRSYQLALRPERFYKPFTMHLQDFKFDRYAGSPIPKNFSSRIRLERPATGEDREIVIKMNDPLRYNGETYYQADWDHDDEKGTILQVVHNPGWLTPYFSCVLVGLGLVVQFGTHLVGFLAKQRTA